MLKYYNSIDNCLMWRFALVAERNDLNWLLRDEEEPNKIDLEPIYQKIVGEYAKITSSENQNNIILSTKKQILSLLIKHDIVKLACFALKNDPCNPEAIDILRKEGYVIYADRCEIEQVYEILHKATNLITKWKIKEAELDALIKTDEDKANKAIDFVDYVADLSVQLGREINYKDMTIRQWIAFERALIKNQKEKSKAK